MRGFKRADTVLPILFLLASLGGVLAGVPFQSLIGSPSAKAPNLTPARSYQLPRRSGGGPLAARAGVV